MTLSPWLNALQNRLAKAHMRAAVHLHGPAEAVQTQLATLSPDGDTLWLHSSRDTPLMPVSGFQPVGPNQAQHYLGSERRLLVVDGFSGLDPNMLLALAGTLTAGGVLLLATPPDWSARSNPALTRFTSLGQSLPDQSRIAKRLLAMPHLIPALNDLSRLDWLKRPACPTAPAPPPLPPTRCVLVEGRRGRGKSTLLARWVEAHPARTIAVVTNHRAALGSFLRGLAAQGWLNDGVSPIFTRSPAGTPQRTLKIWAPEAFLAQKPPVELLVIDEAARLTLPVLQKLLNTFGGPVLMASTTEGYEGAGQGLRLKLDGTIDHTVTLTEPVRWASDDPLEQDLDAALLPDAPLPGVGAATFNPDALTLRRWLPDETDTLPVVFSLLKRAHYQTRPSDLMLLLDGPGTVWLAEWNERIVGVLWQVPEGGLSEVNGHVRGHLAAQRLAQVTGDLRWLVRPSQRISRVAVHPALQGHGIGTRLVRHAMTHLDGDFLSVSCASEPRLERFWSKLGFRLLHRGHRPNRASGVPSMILVYEPPRT